MLYPALDVRGADPELVLAAVDDLAPTAVEDLTDGISIYFISAARRDQARAVVMNTLRHCFATARDVDDEDWARRSQQNLTPITVGRVTVTPPWYVTDRPAPSASSDPPDPLGLPGHPDLPGPPDRPITVVIEPSMGFGTGHHATTRLCLAALQAVGVAGRSVLDVGTGSGVLAIAAARLGATEARGVDFDADAIQNALENRDLNPEAGGVRFEVADLREQSFPQADVVIANLTGAVLVQNAGRLLSLVGPAGTLIMSGLLIGERDEVTAAFAGAALTWSDEEAGWAALAFNPPARSHV